MFGRLRKIDIAIVFGTAIAATQSVVQKEDVKKVNKKTLTERRKK
ncbi:MAG: hypothetical protein UT90_C0023G0006 [Parcubacteria group bacterium GW2011_GWA1_40_21]|nr:MAG: hypothetical protein UT90_C0023G0006 [Parcubacteria group bacterium GW2011_GWA1_40_21]